MPEKRISIDGVGNVLIRHSKRARHLNISIRPFVGARVSIPVGMSYNNAIRFVTCISSTRSLSKYDIWQNVLAIMSLSTVDG